MTNVGGIENSVQCRSLITSRHGQLKKIQREKSTKVSFDVHEVDEYPGVCSFEHILKRWILIMTI